MTGLGRAKGLTRTPFAPRSSTLEPGPGPARRTRLRSAVAGRAAEGGAGKSAAARTRRTAPRRAESFPPAVAALIDARDRWCVRCGSPRDLQRHHRRIKGIGGDPRPHTDCACNSARLCLACHEWAHSAKGRREAEAEGLIIPRSETAPWRRSVMVHTGADSGFTGWPTCDGGWAFQTPEGAVA